jgi:GntR family transcriptional regulator
LDFKEFVATLSSHVSANPMSTSSRPVLGTPRLQGEGGFSLKGSFVTTLLPVYYQIKQTIRNWIIDKEFRPGAKIPSENELSEKFQVSRLTIRQAISQLVQEGFLISKRGAGTFVTKNDGLIKSFGLEFSGFMDDLFYQISKSKTKSVKLTTMIVPKSIRPKLKLEKGNEEIIQIKRVRFLEKKPFAYTINYLPIEIGRRIKEQDLYKKPLLQIMEQDMGITFVEALQTIEASFANQEVAEKLAIPSGAPILFVERIMYAQKGKPVEVVQSSYRGDLYKYIVRLKNIKRKDEMLWVHQYK